MFAYYRVTEVETPPSEYCIHSRPVDERNHTTTQEHLLNSSNPNSFSNNVWTNGTTPNDQSSPIPAPSGVSSTTGIRCCAHRGTLRSPVTTLRDKDTDTRAHHGKPNVSN